MSEFSLIERFCEQIGPQHDLTRLAVGDDAAVIRVPEGMELAVSVDTMVEGVHFFPNTNPADLAYKLLAVNLSDMAAMGAQAKWATISLSKLSLDEAWLASFSDSLNTTAEHHGVQVIGGDTTKGQLTLSLTIMGLLPIGKAITRRGAKFGDDLFVSNTLGDAALALQCLNDNINLPRVDLETLTPALYRPQPQLALGAALLDIATSGLDISDGLLGDLSHIAKQSGVGIEVEIDKLPVSFVYRGYLERGGTMTPALTGGDDYQLAFTANVAHRKSIAEIAAELDMQITRIGRIVESDEHAVKILKSGQAVTIDSPLGYQHFSN